MKEAAAFRRPLVMNNSFWLAFVFDHNRRYDMLSFLTEKSLNVVIVEDFFVARQELEGALRASKVNVGKISSVYWGPTDKDTSCPNNSKPYDSSSICESENPGYACLETSRGSGCYELKIRGKSSKATGNGFAHLCAIATLLMLVWLQWKSLRHHATMAQVMKTAHEKK